MAWVCANGGVVAGRALVAFLEQSALQWINRFKKNAVHGQRWSGTRVATPFPPVYLSLLRNKSIQGNSGPSF